MRIKLRRWVHGTWMKNQPVSSLEILGLIGITVLTVIVPALGGVPSHTLCQSTDVTVPLLNDTGTPEATGLLVSDPVPTGLEVTCSTRLLFSSNVQLTVTLLNILMWNKTQGAESDGFGWKLVTLNGITKLQWTQIEGQSWKNQSSKTCPYLNVMDESRAPILLRVNRSQELFTKTLDISLLQVPNSASCFVTIQYTASVLGKELCHSARGFYCESSASCVLSRQRCTGDVDCSNGEGAENCSNGSKPGALTLSSTAGVVSGTVVAIVAAAALLVSLLYHRRRLSIRRRKGKPRSVIYSASRASPQAERAHREEYGRSLEEILKADTNTHTDIASERLYAKVDGTYQGTQPHPTLSFSPLPVDVRTENYYEHLQEIINEHPYEISMISNNVHNNVVYDTR